MSSSSRGNAFGRSEVQNSGAGGLRFKTRAGQIEYSVETARTAATFFQRSCVARAKLRITHYTTHYTLLRITASTRKDLL